MPRMLGPKESQNLLPNGAIRSGYSAFEVSCATVGEAIRAYEQHFNVSIQPHEQIKKGTDQAAKYYQYINLVTGQSLLVDLHIRRDGISICPKQDLSFALLPNDILLLGPLIC